MALQLPLSFCIVLSFFLDSYPQKSTFHLFRTTLLSLLFDHLFNVSVYSFLSRIHSISVHSLLVVYRQCFNRRRDSTWRRPRRRRWMLKSGRGHLGSRTNDSPELPLSLLVIRGCSSLPSLRPSAAAPLMYENCSQLALEHERAISERRISRCFPVSYGTERHSLES